MKYRLGDFVRFVDEKMEGFVTRIIDDQMIGVTGEDDFEIPVLASKVTSVHGYKSDKSDSNTITEQLLPVTEFLTKGIYLGITADATDPNRKYLRLPSLPGLLKAYPANT